MGKRRQGRWQATAAGAQNGEKKGGGEWKEEGKHKPNNLVLKLMAKVGCCGTLTALRGPASAINTVSDINNNT